MTSNSRTSLDALWIRLIDRVDGLVVNEKMKTSHSLQYFKLSLLSFKLSISACFKLYIMARLPLSQEDVNNFMATLLLRKNRQFIGHLLHPPTAAIRIESLRGFYQRLDNESRAHMLRDMSIAILRELREIDSLSVIATSNNYRDKNRKPYVDKNFSTTIDWRFNTIEQLEIFELRAFIITLITNQMPRMLRDMSIDVLRELRGFFLDNDNINTDGGNNTQQNNLDDINNEGQPVE
ncbi:hypothetical protein Patl1_14771 [Pistacia atlantica]|uniref:Uncharacterized protein n=1 Tax=Pistacia atlantica TaxID=434234 RepID=A0ACC1AXP7_9ROSI|nr:hypothetical protein Patl1_14771 [Pistacia atlantica]